MSVVSKIGPAGLEECPSVSTTGLCKRDAVDRGSDVKVLRDYIWLCGAIGGPCSLATWR